MRTPDLAIAESLFLPPHPLSPTLTPPRPRRRSEPPSLLSHTHNSYPHTSPDTSDPPPHKHSHLCLRAHYTQQTRRLVGSHPASWHPGSHTLHNSCPPVCLQTHGRAHTLTHTHTLVHTLYSPTAPCPSAFLLCGFNPTAALVPSLCTPDPMHLGNLGGRRPCLLRTGSLGLQLPLVGGGVSGKEAWREPLEDTG